MREDILHTKRDSLFTYTLPFLVPFATLILQVAIGDMLVKPFVWFLFYPTAFFMAWIGGLRGAIIATSVSAGVVWYFFIPPTFVLIKENITHYLAATVFILVGFSFGLLQEKLKKADVKIHLKAKIIETISEAVMTTTPDGVVTSVNPAFTKMTGYSEQETIGQTLRIIKSGHHDSMFYKILWETISSGKTWCDEIWNRRKNGEIFLAKETISPIKNSSGNIVNYVSVMTDITLEKAEQESVKYKAYHDPLTELPNRLLFLDRLEYDIKLAKRNQTVVALMYIDLDRFKYVNDTYGHATGDKLLQEATKRIQSSVREIDTVARIGGDEFTAIFIELNSKAEIEIIANKIINLLKEPFFIDDYQLNISGSIGIAFYPSDSDNIEDLLILADKAMYRAKENGKNQYVTHS